MNGCYPFPNSHNLGCPCPEVSRQHDVSEGNFYQTPPPAHRSSLYPGSMPEGPGFSRSNRQIYSTYDKI